jgi:hypothetical protein
MQSSPFPHFGLYFTRDHVAYAQQNRESPVLAAAWEHLKKPALELLPSVQRAAIGYRFLDDAETVPAALDLFAKCVHDAQSRPCDGSIELSGHWLALIHAFECFRDHSALHDDQRDQFLRTFASTSVAQTAASAGRYGESLWALALTFASAIANDDSESVNGVIAHFQRIVAEDIRPQGFIAKVVGGEDGGSLFRQITASAALVLIAEMGAHIGANLWTYNVRGVSVVTTAMYPIYYFYTTAKWKFDRRVSEEAVQVYLRRHAGYLEMLNKTMQQHKDLATVLEDLRPVNDIAAGGFTTLTHAVVEKKRRGLFG